MTGILVITFIIFTIIFAFFVVPKSTENIALDAGFEKRRWYFYSIVLNVLALIWLYISLNSGMTKQKMFLVLLVIIYFMIFFGFYAIDTYTSY